MNYDNKVAFTVKEIANILEVSEETVRRYTRAGKLKVLINESEGIGTKITISKEDLINFVNSNQRFFNSNVSKITAETAMVTGVASVAVTTLPLGIISTVFKAIFSEGGNFIKDSTQIEKIEKKLSEIMLEEIKIQARQIEEKNHQIEELLKQQSYLIELLSKK